MVHFLRAVFLQSDQIINEFSEIFVFSDEIFEFIRAELQRLERIQRDSINERFLGYIINGVVPFIHLFSKKIVKNKQMVLKTQDSKSINYLNSYSKILLEKCHAFCEGQITWQQKDILMAFFGEEGQTIGYNKVTFEKIGVKNESFQREQSFNQENMSIECEEESVPLIEEKKKLNKKKTKKILPKEKEKAPKKGKNGPKNKVK